MGLIHCCSQVGSIAICKAIKQPINLEAFVGMEVLVGKDAVIISLASPPSCSPTLDSRENDGVVVTTLGVT